MFKSNTRNTDAIVISLLLTFNLIYTLVYCFFIINFTGLILENKGMRAV